MTKIAIVYFSEFKGNTESLAHAVKRGAESVPDTAVTLLHTNDVDANWPVLHEADAIIFGTPTYIGSIAAKFKEFIEKLAGEVWLKRMWMNKIAGGFTVSAGRSGDKLSCLQQLVTFATQMGMIWVPVRITGGNYSSQGSEEGSQPHGGLSWRYGSGQYRRATGTRTATEAISRPPNYMAIISPMWPDNLVTDVAPCRPNTMNMCTRRQKAMVHR